MDWLLPTALRWWRACYGSVGLRDCRRLQRGALWKQKCDTAQSICSIREKRIPGSMEVAAIGGAMPQAFCVPRSERRMCESTRATWEMPLAGRGVLQWGL